MSERFTPAPWECEHGSDEYYFVCGLDAMEFPVSDRQANARLIAAAPDLYNALEALMASDGARGTFDALKAYDAKIAAEAALAKAKGGDQ